MNTLTALTSLTNNRSSLVGDAIMQLLSASGRSAVVAAYHTKLVNSSYTGPLVNVRRGSDNATSDFYANTTGYLGTGYKGTGTTLTSWLNGATGYVATWYDQSGNAKHVTQATTSSQPTIIQSTETYVYFTGSLNLTGANVFTTSPISNMQLIFASKEIARVDNALISLNGTDSTNTSRFSVHTPWSDGKWYFDPGNSTGDRCQSTAGITSVGTRAVFSGYKSSSDNKNGFTVNQGTTYLSSSFTSAAVTGGILFNCWNGFGNPNHYLYGVMVFNAKLSSSDEDIVETNI